LEENVPSSKTRVVNRGKVAKTSHPCQNAVAKTSLRESRGESGCRNANNQKAKTKETEAWEKGINGNEVWKAKSNLKDF